MSTIIMSACWPLEGMSAPQKAVLISLADMANDDGVCWPSVAHLARRTCLSPRSVQNAIKWLMDVGLLVATERAGRSTIYTVTPAAYAPPQEMRGAAHDITPAAGDTTPAAGDTTPAGGAPAPAPPAPITVKNHQRTVKEPTNTPAARVESYSVADLVAFGVDDQVAAEFLAIRTRKKAPLTPLALKGLQREAGKAGLTLDEVLRKCVERGWQGFDAAWMTNTTASGRKAPAAENFKEKAYVGTDEADIDWL